MEEFKKKGYYPAGGRSSSTSAANITYNNSSSGIDATNVQQAIDAVAQGGGGGGESNVIVINCTPVEDSKVTTDKSFTEVVAGVLAGKSLLFNFKLMDEGKVYLIQSANVWLAQGDFENPTIETLTIACVLTEDYWVYTGENTMEIM